MSRGTTHADTLALLKEFFASNGRGPTSNELVLLCIERNRGAFHLLILNPRDWVWGRYYDETLTLEGWGIGPFFAVYTA